ncbi:MAG: hypothetical protein HY360_01140 [Verrucomicrobia bacterium]|nr:hypothetical protein [Verrucomicrobiota bacterium]
MNLERGLTQCISAWQREGFDSIVVLETPANHAEHDLAIVKKTLQLHRVRHSIMDVVSAEIPNQVRRLIKRSNVGIMVVYHSWYESLCNQFPQVMEQLFMGCRVLLAQGPVYHPAFHGKKLLVDSISWNYREIAKRIVLDLNAGKIDTPDRLATFHTRYEPRVDLGTVSREI